MQLDHLNEPARGHPKPTSPHELPAHHPRHTVRDHWSIENALHHVRDVVSAEEASRIRTKPGVFALLRTCALNLPCQAERHKSSPLARALDEMSMAMRTEAGLLASLRRVERSTRSPQAEEVRQDRRVASSP